MGENRESDDFEDDADEGVESDDADLEHLFKDLETQKRRGAPKPGEPAWRRLEKYMEQKRTAELLSDFEDFDLGDEDQADDASDVTGDVEPDGSADDAADDEPGFTNGRRRAR